MKNTAFFLSITLILFSSSLTFAKTADEWKETVRIQLNKILPGESFSLESIEYVSVSDKEVRGKGTFFSKSGVGFTVKYDSENSIGLFSAQMPTNSQISLTNAELIRLAGKNLHTLLPDAIKASVALDRFAFHFSKENKNVKQFDLNCIALKNWELFSSANIKLEEIDLDFQVFDPTQKEKRSYRNGLTGLLKIAGREIAVSADLTENKEDLKISGMTGDWGLKSSLQALTNKKKIWDFDMPDFIVDVNLSNVELSFSPYKDLMSLDAVTNLGKVNVWFKQQDKKKNDYLVTFALHKDAKMSKIHEKLAVIDFVPLGGQKIVLSSAEKTKKETKKIPSLAQVKMGVKKGCSFIASIDLTKLKVDHILGVKELILSSPLTAKLDNIHLDHTLETNLSLGENATLKNVTVRLTPAPKNFALTLLGDMETKADKDNLIFSGGVEIVLAEQKVNFSALMKGTWSNPLGAQGLSVSNLGIQFGASLTTAPVILPNVALAGEMKVGKFMGNAAVAFDTRNPSKCMLSVDFDELKMYDLVDLIISDNISKKIPKSMKTALSEAKFRDVFLEAVPINLRVLEKEYKSGVRSGGEIEVSGFKAEGGFDISYQNGIMMRSFVDPVEFLFFKLRGANGQRRPGFLLDLRKGEKKVFAVNGAVGLLGLEGETDIHFVDKGFQFMVGGKIFGLFAGEITARGTDILKAEEMYLNVKLQNDFFDFIKEDVSGFVKKGTANGVSLLKDAHNAIAKAEKGVQAWDKKIKSKRREIKSKQANYLAAFNTAKSKVEKAEKKVKSLNVQIKDAQKKYDAAAKWNIKEKTYQAGRKKAYEASKLTAIGVLKTAQFGLDGLKWVVSDPDRDPQVITLKANKNVSLKALKTAKNLMSIAQKGLGAGGNATAWILEKGPDAIVDIKKAEFEGQLGLLKGGKVKLKVDVKWLGKIRKLKLDFDFNNPVEAAKELSKELMKIKA